MRRLAAVFLALALGFLVQPVLKANAEGEFSVTARAVCVMDADTGKVIISKNMNMKLPPASTTKVMTAVVALERTKPGEMFRVSAHAASMSPSKVYLRPGDAITVEALLYSMLLKSANDSACAIAEGVAGSEDAFAKLMTEKAHQIGAVDTNFRDASGLPCPDHYTTAYDLALMFRYALTDPRFVQISSTKFATLNLGEKERMLLKNHNKLLWCYDGAGAGKTGWTSIAQQCYVGEASCGNQRLIVAFLHGADIWGDARRLLDKGFQLSMAGQTLAMGDTGDNDSFIKKVSYTVPLRARHHTRHHVRHHVRHNARHHATKSHKKHRRH